MEEDRILTREDVLERTSIGAATMYRLIRANRFPRQVQLGPKRVGWRASDVDRWISERPPVESRGARAGRGRAG